MPKLNQKRVQKRRAMTSKTKRLSGDRKPIIVNDVRVESLSNGLIVAEFSTLQGPAQIAMTPTLTQLVIERLTAELAHLGMRQFPQPS